MHYDFFFWWSVISTIIGIILLAFSIWQVAQAQNEKSRKKDQVKIWMQSAFGLMQGITRIVQDNLDKRYSSKNDIANAVWACQANAFALYQSLYEERCVSEEEYKQSQIELRNELKKQQSKGNLISNNPEDKK